MSRCTSLLAAGSAGLLTIAIAGAAPTATLARSPPRAPKLIVFPVSPKAASGIDMSFRSGGKLVPPSRFQVVIHSGDDQTCSSDVAGVITRVPRRPATIHATLAPTLPSASGSGPRGWCPGTATATLYRFGRTGTTATPLASRAFTISPDPRFIPEPLGTRLRIELLEPSTIELRRQGQPDQRSAITGTLDGFIAGRVLRSADPI